MPRGPSPAPFLGDSSVELVEDLGSVVDNLATDSQRLLVSNWQRRREIRLRRGELSPDGYYRDCFDYEALGTVLLEPFASGPRLWRFPDSTTGRTSR